jgi:GntR family transcriptional regulator
METGHKLCWTDIYIRPKVSGLLGHISLDERPVRKIFEEVFDEKIQKVKLVLSAGTYRGKRAEQLEIEDGTAALRVVRQYSATDGRVAEVFVSDHPKDRHTYRLEFSCETLGS